METAEKLRWFVANLMSVPRLQIVLSARWGEARQGKGILEGVGWYSDLEIGLWAQSLEGSFPDTLCWVACYWLEYGSGNLDNNEIELDIDGWEVLGPTRTAVY